MKKTLRLIAQKLLAFTQEQEVVKSTEAIILNRIQTPDGTIITSHFTHDYVTYVDKNGYEYMVDGGNSYLRRNRVDIYPYTELSIFSNAPFEVIRTSLHWGNRGKDGKQPLEYRPIATMSDSHIKAILETQTQITEKLQDIFQMELDWREAKGLALIELDGSPSGVLKLNLKPIFKFNNGNGATLCHRCRTIITTGKPSNHVLCEKCLKDFQDLWNETIGNLEDS